MSLKPITVYGHSAGPNPWKVILVLEELGLPYEQEFPKDLKAKPFTDINPNGRAPAIKDPNTGIILWESGAIIEYIVETYDKGHKLSIDSFPEKWYAKQFLMFQVSGQGPYYGQGAWFAHFHSEQLPSAIERYKKEIARVASVLDTCLEGKEYLVANKCTYADLAFLTWHVLIGWIGKDEPIDLSAYKNYNAWTERLMARPAVKKVFEAKAALAKH